MTLPTYGNQLKAVQQVRVYASERKRAAVLVESFIATNRGQDDTWRRETGRSVSSNGERRRGGQHTTAGGGKEDNNSDGRRRQWVEIGGVGREEC